MKNIVIASTNPVKGQAAIEIGKIGFFPMQYFAIYIQNHRKLTIIYCG